MKKKKLLKIIQQSECELDIIVERLDMPIFEDLGMATGIAFSQIQKDIDSTRKKLDQCAIRLQK